MSTPILEPRPARRPPARWARVTLVTAATVVAVCLLGPLWFLAPVVAATIYFSPRLTAPQRRWRLHDEGAEEAREIKAMRKQLEKEIP